MRADTLKTLLSAAILSLAILSSGCNSEEMDMTHAGPVMNYHRVDDRLVTGGHLIDGGLAKLQEQGIKVVIDLRDHPPAGEEERLAEYGIKWINVPVEWREPLAGDFDRFSSVMRENEDVHVMVQCAANYRASALTYLYQVVVDGVPEAQARQDLDAIWNPDENDTWRAYIEDIKSR
jgi:protein tyrosine phosphatase (PTP) superfamily phosphohydrolase (DUF442 family)